MKTRCRLRLESLENKLCPAIAATLKSGTLTISGKADNGTIAIIQDTGISGKISVYDGLTLIGGSAYSGVANVRLVLGTADDFVSVDLGGKALPGNLAAYLGNGANSLAVTNGALNRLTVNSGSNDDTITLGDSVNGLQFTDGTLILNDGYDTLNIQSDVKVVNNLSSYYSNDFTFAAGATVNNLLVRGGAFGNSVDVSGNVAGNLKVYSYFITGSLDGSLIDVTGDVDGSVYIYGSNQDDTVTLSGNVGINATVYGYNGNDSIDVDGTVTCRLFVDAGAGDDSITVSATVGSPVTINGGNGQDSLTIASSATFLASARVSMGGGYDTVSLNNAASFTTLLANGSTGIDTFIGNKSKTGLTLVSFEL